MFKRLILSKEQERLFRSLPKPNLVNLDVIKEAENAEKTLDYEIREMELSSKFSFKKSMTSIDKSRNTFRDSRSRKKTRLDLQIEGEKAYSELKSKEDKDEITKKLVKAYEKTMVGGGKGKKKDTRRVTSFGPFSLERYRKTDFLKEMDLVPEDSQLETARRSSDH